MSDSILAVSETVVEIVDVLSQDTLLIEEPVVEAVELLSEETLVVEEIVIEIISEGIQGPPGPAGTTEDEVPYSKRTDFVGDTVIYRGRAVPGALESAAVWSITRLTIGVDGDVDERFANGSAGFDSAWADRLTLTYI